MSCSFIYQLFMLHDLGEIKFICFDSFIANTFWVYATFDGYTVILQNGHVEGSSVYDK